MRLQVVGLVWFASENHLAAATTVTITNDWASAGVQLVAPKPQGGPPVYEWADARQGEAKAELKLTQTGMEPTYGWFSGSATAHIGPSVSYSNLPDGYTQVFGSYLLADDNGSCEAQATINSIWRMSITGDAAPFYAGGFVEMGHSMDFTLFDCTTGQDLVSKSISGSNGFNQFGTLEPSHDYLLTLRQRAPFGSGDGQVGFGFGFSSPVPVEFASERSHLAIPEVSSLSLLALGVLLLVRRRGRRCSVAWG